MSDAAARQLPAPYVWGFWLAPLALFPDVADGWLARRGDAETIVGGYADSLADATFWTWFALRHEPHCQVRAATMAASAGPAVVVTIASVVRGRMRPARVTAAPLGWRLAALARPEGAARSTTHLARPPMVGQPDRAAVFDDWGLARRELGRAGPAHVMRRSRARSAPLRPERHQALRRLSAR